MLHLPFDSYLQFLSEIENRKRNLYKKVSKNSKIRRNLCLNKIAPSILAASFEREIKRLKQLGPECAHIDDMDDALCTSDQLWWVPSRKSSVTHSKMVFDCHLMVSNPEHH